MCPRKIRCASVMAGEQRRLCPTQKGILDARTMSRMRYASSSVAASGFSVNSGFPASAAARITGNLIRSVVARQMASTSASEITSLKSVLVFSGENFSRQKSRFSSERSQQE